MRKFRGLVFTLFLSFTVAEHLEPVDLQLPRWKAEHPTIDRCTDLNGIPFPSLTASLAVNVDGPVLLMDRALIERTVAFNRERIPERVVHAKGTVAHGTFTVTHDVTQWTKAKFLNRVMKRTPVFIRISTTSGELGFPDTIRDAKGFAIKFYTEDGNFDLVGNQIEVFNVRDPMIFPDINRSRKRNPQTHLRDPNMMFDFVSQRPETTHHLLKGHADLTTPESLRMINGSGVHTFQLVNDRNQSFFCKFHLISHQPFELMSEERMLHLAGEEPNWFQRELYNEIANARYPKWTMALQVATPEQAERYRWDYLDITKNWRIEDFPLYPVGILELNRNVVDFFTESEQSAFSPANLVPGIEPSADRMLHARMFAYADAARYRLGINWNQLPINRPLNKVASYERDGLGCFGDNGAGGPNYHPNSFNGPEVDPTARTKSFTVSGTVGRFDTRDADNFSQAQLYLDRDITPEERQRIATRLGKALSKVTATHVREAVFRNNLMPLGKQFADMVRRAMEEAMMNPPPQIPGRV